MRFFILIFLLCVACEKRDPQPELKDEVYSILSAEAESYSKAREKNLKDIEDTKKTLENPATLSNQIPALTKDLEKHKKSLQFNSQRFFYYSIRKNEWAKMVRLSAMSIEEQKETKDYYVINQRLRNSPKDYSKRQAALEAAAKVKPPSH